MTNEELQRAILLEAKKRHEENARPKQPEPTRAAKKRNGKADKLNIENSLDTKETQEA